MNNSNTILANLVINKVLMERAALSRQISANLLKLAILSAAIDFRDTRSYGAVRISPKACFL